MCYYKKVESILCNKELLDRAERILQHSANGILTQKDAQNLLIICDEQFTEAEKNSVSYLLRNLDWTEPAKKELKNALGNLVL